VQCEKQDEQSTSTDDGITISCNPLPWKADFSIRINFDGDSNVSETKNLHPEQQDGPSTSTDDGITMSCNPLSLKADSSIRINLEPFSNAARRLCSNNASGDGIHKRFSRKSSRPPTAWLIHSLFEGRI
jgi:hypothetical protein